MIFYLMKIRAIKKNKIKIKPFFSSRSETLKFFQHKISDGIIKKWISQGITHKVFKQNAPLFVYLLFIYLFPFASLSHLLMNLLMNFYLQVISEKYLELSEKDFRQWLKQETRVQNSTTEKVLTEMFKRHPHKEREPKETFDLQSISWMPFGCQQKGRKLSNTCPVDTGLTIFRWAQLIQPQIIAKSSGKLMTALLFYEKKKWFEAKMCFSTDQSNDFFGSLETMFLEKIFNTELFCSYEIQSQCSNSQCPKLREKRSFLSFHLRFFSSLIIILQKNNNHVFSQYSHNTIREDKGDLEKSLEDLLASTKKKCSALCETSHVLDEDIEEITEPETCGNEREEIINFREGKIAALNIFNLQIKSSRLSGEINFQNSKWILLGASSCHKGHHTGLFYHEGKLLNYDGRRQKRVQDAKGTEIIDWAFYGKGNA